MAAETLVLLYRYRNRTTIRRNVPDSYTMYELHRERRRIYTRAERNRLNTQMQPSRRLFLVVSSHLLLTSLCTKESPATRCDATLCLLCSAGGDTFPHSRAMNQILISEIVPRRSPQYIIQHPLRSSDVARRGARRRRRPR